MPGRPRDSFGLGWARTESSDNFVPFLRQRLSLGLDREDAIEMYYNVSITPWLNATLDLQILDPGLKKTSTSRPDSSKTSTPLSWPEPAAVLAGLDPFQRWDKRPMGHRHAE